MNREKRTIKLQSVPSAAKWDLPAGEIDCISIAAMIDTVSQSGSRRNFFDFGPDAKVWLVGFLVVLGLLAAWFYRGINRAWIEDDNYYGAIYAQAAHNNLRAGLGTTAAVPATLYFGPLPIPRDAFYVHHPTLLPLLETATFAVLGEAEWSTRLVPVFSSLLSLVLIWLLVGDCVNRRAAMLSAAVFAFLPMEFHYGDMVDFEPCLVMLMLAALVCLRYWQKGRAIWGWLAALCCLLAVNMDWPGYLFVLSVTGWFLWKGPKNKRLFALALLGLCGVSGIVFLLQIRHVNPDAWTDLLTALKMRLGNGVGTGSSAAEAHQAVHFTLGQWWHAVSVNALYADFLYTPWILAGIGVLFIVIKGKESAGLRWAGWAAFHMIVTGVLYVVILRNESFIHDFTAFYLIGSVGILAGLGGEALIRWVEPIVFLRSMRIILIAGLLGWLAYSGIVQSEKMRSPFYMLDGVTAEPTELIPDMGKFLAAKFPPGTTIFCNFDPYSSVLPYYAQRTILTSLTSFEFWKDYMAQDKGPFGGVIWVDAPEASEILSELPKNEVTPFDLDGFHFALWRPGK